MAGYLAKGSGKVLDLNARKVRFCEHLLHSSFNNRIYGQILPKYTLLQLYETTRITSESNGVCENLWELSTLKIPALCLYNHETIIARNLVI